MQVCRYYARRDEPDPELLWLAVSVGGVVAAGLWLAAGLPWPHCLMLAVTGHPCVTCGATRAAIQFLHGNFFEAWRWNPLMFAFFCGIALFDAYAVVVLATGAPRLRVSGVTAAEKNFIRLLVVVMLGLNWLYLLANSSRYV
jgi:Protein of unknown function (DUF2752)